MNIVFEQWGCCDDCQSAVPSNGEGFDIWPRYRCYNPESPFARHLLATPRETTCPVFEKRRERGL